MGRRRAPTQPPLWDSPPASLPPRSTKPTNSHLYGFIGFYHDHIREVTPDERRSAFRLLTKLLASGVTGDMIWTALKLYAEDPWRKQGGAKFSKSIRSFLTRQTIAAWQQPAPKQRRDASTQAFAKISGTTAAITPDPGRFVTREDDYEEAEL